MRGADLPSNRIAAIEVKAGVGVGARDIRHLTALRDRLGARFAAGVVLHSGPDVLPLGDRLAAVPPACGNLNSSG